MAKRLKNYSSNGILKVFKCELYPIIFVLSIGVKDEDLIDFWHKKFKHDKNFLKEEFDSVPGASAFCWEIDGIVLLNFFSSPTLVKRSTISHEIAHATFFICDRLGVDYTKSPQEAYCYLNGWITGRIYELISEEAPK